MIDKEYKVRSIGDAEPPGKFLILLRMNYEKLLNSILYPVKKIDKRPKLHELLHLFLT